MEIKDKAKIMASADKIAHMINDINTDYRGNLYWEIAKFLRNEGQNYTAILFEKMAQEYGIHDDGTTY